jgi:hypothetical protein
MVALFRPTLAAGDGGRRERWVLQHHKTLTLPALRAGPLPLPQCGRGAFASAEGFQFVDKAADDAEAVRPEFGVGGV